MKKVFRLKSGVFGEGKPKICVPIVAKNQTSIWKKAEEIACLPADIVEWRVDFYQHALETKQVLETLYGLRKRLANQAILFTFRTGKEGGEREISEKNYWNLNLEAASSGLTDLLDVEAFFEEKRTIQAIEEIHRTGCKVVASNHDFHKTPPTDEMVFRLSKMEEMGADVAKLAVMPLDSEDVLHLLYATLHADKKLTIPIITMSMGKMGMFSRISGSLTGSAMTFASVGEVSAPGQMPLEKVAEILDFFI